MLNVNDFVVLIGTKKPIPVIRTEYRLVEPFEKSVEERGIVLRSVLPSHALKLVMNPEGLMSEPFTVTPNSKDAVPMIISEPVALI
jgi:hypothetical protein